MWIHREILIPRQPWLAPCWYHSRAGLGLFHIYNLSVVQINNFATTNCNPDLWKLLFTLNANTKNNRLVNDRKRISVEIQISHRNIETEFRYFGH